MAIRELYHSEIERMRVAGFISGSGSNLVEIIKREKKIESEEGVSPYQVVAIFSENPESNAESIGEKFGIPVIVRDMSEFYREKGKPRRDLDVRKEFDEETVRLLKPHEVDVVAYAGYMSVATDPLIEAFLGVNVHPADLSIMDGDKRKYTGVHAVRDAILSGEKQLRATTHIIETQVDYGRILMISSPLTVNLPSNFDVRSTKQLDSATDYWQNRLKEMGDWIIFPRTLEYIADGRYSQDENGNLYFDDNPIPFGLKLNS